MIANTLVGVYLENPKEASVNELGRAKDQVHSKVKNTEAEIIALAQETSKYRDRVPDDLKAKMDTGRKATSPFLPGRIAAVV